MKTTKSQSAQHTPGSVPLFYHKTSGGAEYLTDRFVLCPNGDKEGIFAGANYVIRIDGDITKDAVLTVRDIARDGLAKENRILRAALTSIAAGTFKDTGPNDLGYITMSREGMMETARDAIAKAKGQA